MCARFHLVCLLLCLGHLAIGQGMADARLDIHERVFTASKIYSLLQLNHSLAPGRSILDLDSFYENYLHEILAADDRRQFDLATIQFVAQLHSGHTFFWDAWLNENNDRPLGFYAFPLDGKWAVETSLLDNLKPGDIISKINDTAIEAFFLQQQRYISASSRAAQRRNLFLLPYLFPERFTLTLEDGRQVAINRATLSKPPQKTEGRWLNPGATAYIRIPSFFDPAMEEMALDFLRQFHGAKVLIIDVRNNPGGIPPERLIRALMNRPYRGWSVSPGARDTLCTTDQEGGQNGKSAIETERPGGVAHASRPNGPISPSRNAFQGRLILLVDGGCISACEDFVEPSKDSGRGVLLGETTQGSAGLPFIYDFRNGMSLRIAIKRNYFPDGSEFEGVGIKPDVEVHTTIEDLKNGRDPVLDKAMELAAKP